MRELVSGIEVIFGVLPLYDTGIPKRRRKLRQHRPVVPIEGSIRPVGLAPLYLPVPRLPQSSFRFVVRVTGVIRF